VEGFKKGKTKLKQYYGLMDLNKLLEIKKEEMSSRHFLLLDLQVALTTSLFNYN